MYSVNCITVIKEKHTESELLDFLLRAIVMCKRSGCVLMFTHYQIRALFIGYTCRKQFPWETPWQHFLLPVYCLSTAADGRNNQITLRVSLALYLELTISSEMKRAQLPPWGCFGFCTCPCEDNRTVAVRRRYCRRGWQWKKKSNHLGLIFYSWDPGDL